MSEYNKGPWRIGAPPPNGEQTIGTQNGMMVAVATTGHGCETEANARLIAAAPELLESLETLAEHFGYYMGDNECRPLENAHAAIAKAKGEQL